MKWFSCLALALLLCGPARADDFLARIAAGRAASATSAGSMFDQSIIPLLGKIGAVCDPPGKVLPPAELGTIDLVASITPAGQLVNVAFMPQTPVAACFAAGLQAQKFDPPPRQGNYPLLIQLTVTN